MQTTNEVKESQNFLSNKYDGLLTELKKLTEINNRQKQEISALTSKCKKLSTDVENLKATVNAHEQKKILNNVVIRGINADENATAAVLNIAQLVNVDISVGDIEYARQISNRNKATSNLVAFKSREKKGEFIKASKSKRISTQMYGYGDESLPIYVDDQLTKETFLLFKETKQLKKLALHLYGYRTATYSFEKRLIRK